MHEYNYCSVTGGDAERFLFLTIVWFHSWVNGIGLVNFEPYELKRFVEYAPNNRRGAVIGRVYLRPGVWGFLVDGGEDGGITRWRIRESGCVG